MRRYALRDDQWERIKDLLPGREGYVGVTANRSGFREVNWTNGKLKIDGLLFTHSLMLSASTSKR